MNLLIFFFFWNQYYYLLKKNDVAQGLISFAYSNMASKTNRKCKLSNTNCEAQFLLVGLYKSASVVYGVVHIQVCFVHSSHDQLQEHTQILILSIKTLDLGFQNATGKRAYELNEIEMVFMC